VIRRITRHPLYRRGLKLSRFLAAGLPAFLVALVLNYLLVTRWHWAEPLAYALVLVVQVTVNFFMCRCFVFEQTSPNPLWMQFGQFFAGIVGFRLADWAVYTVAVEVLGLYFVAVQIANVVIFSVLKYRFSQKVMEA
jgi:putative flippase GtrA